MKARLICFTGAGGFGLMPGRLPGSNNNHGFLKSSKLLAYLPFVTGMPNLMEFSVDHSGEQAFSVAKVRATAGTLITRIHWLTDIDRPSAKRQNQFLSH